jgi:Ca2+-binding RTX toxin-like protein
VVTENSGQGTDTVKTALSSETLDANVENLTYTGSGSFAGTGNTLANTITGGAGADTLDGGTGADTMIGGTGKDTYIVDNAGDVVTEAASAGTDTVKTGLSAYTLGSNVENLIYTGGGTFAGTGNTLANAITGGAGNDTLIGGTGADKLTGGAGADRFVFSAADLATQDEIMDFSHAQADKIDLSAIDANSSASGDQAFAFIGTGAFTGVKGQLHYSGSGPLILSGDMNGDGIADFSIKVDTTVGLVSGDFVL